MKWSNLCMPKFKSGLGFRALVTFNKALLAKQGWQLLTNPNTLLATVLKSKYYPNGNYLDVGLGSMPSYTWRSIHGVHDLLRHGTRWRVGAGENIWVWNTNWLPSPNTFKVNTPLNTLLEEAMVADLIKYRAY